MEKRKLLMAMLDAVFVDTVEEKAVVAIRPKPAFMPIFEIAKTRDGSDVVLINEPPQASNEPEAADLCFWWRRGRVEVPVQKLNLIFFNACRATGRLMAFANSEHPASPVSTITKVSASPLDDI